MAAMHVPLQEANLVLDFLKRYELLQTREALLNECPKLSAASFPPVTMTIEDLIREHEEHKECEQSFAIHGEGLVWASLCKKLQSDIDEIKEFMITSHKKQERSTSIPGRSRSMKKSNLVNRSTSGAGSLRLIRQPVSMSRLSQHPTLAPGHMPPLHPTLSTAKSPAKRKGLSPRKRSNPSLQNEPITLQPDILSTSTQPQSDPEKGMEKIIEKMISDEELHQKIADNINQCVTTGSTSQDNQNLIDSVLELTNNDTTLSQLLESIFDQNVSQPSDPPQPKKNRREDVDLPEDSQRISGVAELLDYMCNMTPITPDQEQSEEDNLGQPSSLSASNDHSCQKPTSTKGAAEEKEKKSAKKSTNGPPVQQLNLHPSLNIDEFLDQLHSK